jgi:uncharacterized metal-binding protein
MLCICICGHSKDLHEFDKDKGGEIFGICNVCECSEFNEDIGTDREVI